jgi:hypothetical protein
VVNDFDIVALTETHLKPKTPDSDIYINNYNLFRKDRLHKSGGGVALYVSNKFHCIRRVDLEPLTSEIMWCEITFKTHKLLFSTIYRPPNQSADEIELFLTNLQESIDLSINDNPYALTLMGDLNDRCSVWDSDHSDSELKNKLINLLQFNNLHQLIKDPTRENNILDLLITDAPNYYITTGVIPSLPYLDHDAIYGHLVFSYKRSGSHLRHVWQYERGDYARLNNLYFNTTWHSDIHDEQELEHCVDHLTTKILDLAGDCIPNRTVNIRFKDKPWFSRILNFLFKDRDRLHKRQKRTKDPRHIQMYKDKRKEATDAYRQAKRDYFANMSVRLLDPQTGPKNYWKLIKNAMGNRQMVGIPTMTENDKQIHDDKDKATLLNDYFIAQTIIPDSNIPLPPFHYNTDARLGNVEITPSIVKQILLKLDISTACGQDLINNKILKECASSLCTPLSALFNKSLELGIFPSNWKEAMITAIFKKQNRQLKNNYRPISLLSCISKVFERIIYKKLYEHLKTNRLLDINNSGFQANDSSVLRLLSLTDDIYQQLDNQNEIILIFMDISKAFDRVWHEGLIHKLKESGIEGNLLSWLESYLSNRKQRVVVGGKSSNTKYIHGGVPQGSILGPLLFLLYISDLSTNLQNQSSLFADDTTIICPLNKNPIVSIQQINNDLLRLSRWADLWRVTFNPDKTVFIRVSNKIIKPHIGPIYLNNTIIKEVEHHPNLGIIYNNKMDWKFHLENIVRKVALKMAYLKRLQLNLPRSALERIYTTMIRPIIEYGDIVYDNLTISQSEKLEQLQRRAALICTGGYKHTEHRVLLNELGWDTLKNRRKSHRLNAYYKMIHTQSPEHIIPHLPTTVSSQSNYNLRNRDNLTPRFTRLHSSLKSFFPNTTRDWNNLPMETRQSDSIGIFKNRTSSTLPFNSYSKHHLGRGGVWLTRIRMGLSALNSHRFTYNMIQSPMCTLCNISAENTLHYFWDCPLHADSRTVLVDRVDTEIGIRIDRANIISICVIGDVEKEYQQNLFNIVSEYLKNTSRFK